LCRVVRQDIQWGDLPILVVTAHTDAESLQQAFTVGADDFITKPVLGPELVTRVLSRIERTRLRRVP
jgi:CheY-like chemotaxis protein